MLVVMAMIAAPARTLLLNEIVYANHLVSFQGRIAHVYDFDPIMIFPVTAV
jgi:hypothetical protein